ncbi:hypothetical protein [Streptomyces pristinaespiralis]|nr:hypothetical protein [Streptomyces pristinaespiralis]
MSSTIEQSVRARLISDAPHSLAVPVVLRYCDTDPFAVRMVFPRKPA